MQGIIDMFSKDILSSTFHCSANLSTYERMLLHEMAEEAQMGHDSVGQGKNRHVVLTKKKAEKATEQRPKPEKEQNLVVCSTCSKQVPKANIDLHKLKCTVTTVVHNTVSYRPRFVQSA